jgi:hypothetical protein
MTLTTASRRFLTQLEADGKSPLTISVYRRELDPFGRWLGAGKDVRTVRPDALARSGRSGAAGDARRHQA